MSVRLYWSPIVGDGQTLETAYRASLADFGLQKVRQLIPSKPRYTTDGDLEQNAGKPKQTHALCIAINDVWTEVDADSTQILLLPDLGYTTKAQVQNRLETTTAADIPLAYRNRWVAMLGQIGARTDDFTGSTPMLKVIRRTVITLDPVGAHVEGFFS